MTKGEVKLYAKVQTLKNGHILESKNWALERRVSELLLSPKEGLPRVKWKLYAKMERSEKRVSSCEEGVELFTGEWVCFSWIPKRDDAENEKQTKKIE